MKYLSVCSGIEAATVAWHPLGWSPVGFSEIEKFPSRVLAHHYPNVRNYGDITNHKRWDVEPFRLLVGGTPCQPFSVAGLRKGMADPRGNLALTYLGIVDDHRPDWFVWENVPGVLSSNGGRDFGSFLGGVAELGYGFAYRVLDAQYVRVDGYGRAVPQRRRRVFVVGNSRSWRRAAAVLFERESLSGNSAPRREAGEGVAAYSPSGIGDYSATNGSGGTLRRNGGDYGGGTETLIASTGSVAHCLNAGAMGRIDYETETMVAHALRGEGFDASEDGTGRGTPIVPVVAKTRACCYPINTQISTRHEALGEGTGMGIGSTDDPAFTLQAGHSHAVATGWAVRRLTPTECERLQGFPDGYTNIGKSADGPRYKALGNSMAVNAMRWIGTRIQMVDDMTKEKAAEAA